MVSKLLITFVIAGQLGQWLFIFRLLLHSDKDKDVLSDFRVHTSSSFPGTAAHSRQLSDTEHPTFSPIITDANHFLDFNANQSLERFRLNSFAPTNADLFYSYLPQIWCPSMVRVGGMEDGGKWICNPWYLRVKSQSERCRIYSIGVGFNLKFDHALTSHYSCEVYAFDPDPMAKRTVEKAAIEGINFYPWAITGANGPRSLVRISIGNLLRRLNHNRLDILKVDIEGGEFEIFDTFLKHGQPLVPVCQIVIEVHTWDVTKWRRMFRQLERAKFYMFSREVNILGFGNKLEKIAIEYSYIHADCLRKFGLDRVPSFRNFPPEDLIFEPGTPILPL